MTFEWALVISVLSICGTFAWVYSETRSKRFQSLEEKAQSISDRLDNLARFHADMKLEFEQTAKIAEEAKKMMSQANLAAGMAPKQRML